MVLFSPQDNSKSSVLFNGVWHEVLARWTSPSWQQGAVTPSVCSCVFNSSHHCSGTILECSVKTSHQVCDISLVPGVSHHALRMSSCGTTWDYCCPKTVTKWDASLSSHFLYVCDLISNRLLSSSVTQQTTNYKHKHQTKYWTHTCSNIVTPACFQTNQWGERELCSETGLGLSRIHEKVYRYNP